MMFDPKNPTHTKLNKGDIVFVEYVDDDEDRDFLGNRFQVSSDYCYMAYAPEYDSFWIEGKFRQLTKKGTLTVTSYDFYGIAGFLWVPEDKRGPLFPFKNKQEIVRAIKLRLADAVELDTPTGFAKEYRDAQDKVIAAFLEEAAK